MATTSLTKLTPVFKSMFPSALAPRFSKGMAVHATAKQSAKTLLIVPHWPGTASEHGHPTALLFQIIMRVRNIHHVK